LASLLDDTAPVFNALIICIITQHTALYTKHDKRL